MNIDGVSHRTIWRSENDNNFENQAVISIIDQRFLPHRFVISELYTSDDVEKAIREMHVRGAPLIGATAAYGMYLAVCEARAHGEFDGYLSSAQNKLLNSRPTAINLAWAVERVREAIDEAPTLREKCVAALSRADQVVEEELERCKLIGKHGLSLIEEAAKSKGDVVNILTHCNAGWLACIDFGTATAPIYLAHDRGIPVHVWVDETRPRNQGANLTAWELQQHGVPHTVVCDNTGGHLMQSGMVDMIIVGSDRTTTCGDVANKIGTYLKALAAKDNNIPFYVALPSSTIDWTLSSGSDIPIEQRDPREVTHIYGSHNEQLLEVQLTLSPAVNYAFDVTPARLVTSIITERGICPASEQGLRSLF